jgi:hypothetical protein
VRPFDELDRRGRLDQLTRLAVVASAIACANSDVTGQQQRLRPRAGWRQAALDEQLVEAQAVSRAGRRGLSPGQAERTS